MKQLLLINKSKLQHHPENPRKNIGDIEELTASIKQDGILQNLTVVPSPDAEDMYYIVIGNRRFEAGLAAGLEEFPCVISDMDHAKQLKTMLVENINRSDLTVLEEADGFYQLTLEGFSVEQLANDTGFSQSTIRKRIKLADYKRNNVEAAIERGATLEDFTKLDKVKKKSDKDKLIKLLGTNDFNLEYKRIIKYQENKAKAIEICTLLKKHNIPEVPKNADTWKSCWKREYSTYDSLIEVDLDMIERILKAKKDFYYKLEIDTYRPYLSLYSYDKDSDTKSEKKPEKSDNEKQYDRAKRFINKIAKEHFQLRFEFIKQMCKTKQLKDYEKICLNALIDESKCYCGLSANNNSTKTYRDLEVFETDWSFNHEGFENHRKAYPAGNAIAVVYVYLKDRDDITCIECCYGNCKSKNKIFSESPHLKRIYKFLVAIGYPISEEEQQILDGTHPIYDIKKGAEFLENLKKGN